MSFREKGTRNRSHPNALPVYSVDTRRDAEIIRATFCAKAYDGRFIIPRFGGELEHLHQLSEMMDRAYRLMAEREGDFDSDG